MNEPNRTQWQIRCAFNGFCKRALKEQSFVIGGKEITAKLLAEALHSLPDEKRETVLLYYFFDMSEREIATYCNIPRTTVQTRRTSSIKLLKRYLEERAYDYKG